MASSSSAYNNSRRKFLVFLSFRGEDTRNNFISHLYTWLVQSGIDTFKDDPNLERGEMIKSELFRVIEGSKLSIVVISESYASSGWCLEELSKILECRRVHDHIVVPVFYNVDPSDVRNQKGSFARAFSQHEEKLKDEMEKVLRWKEALSQLGNIAGYHTRGRDESIIIKEITNLVAKKVMCVQNVSSTLVGMDLIMEEIDELLQLDSNDARILGIWGMGGAGKTTIAESVYQRIVNEFDVRYFFSEVRIIARNVPSWFDENRQHFYRVWADRETSNIKYPLL